MTDVLFIGAGMAGASAAAELATSRDVVVVEMEDHPGLHATGRSAALFDPGYGNATVRALTRASRGFLESPPAGFCEEPLLGPRGVLIIARADQLARLEALEAELAPSSPALRRLGPEEVHGLVPSLRPGHVSAGLHEPTAMDIDVHAMHQGYLRQLKARGGRVVTSAEALHLERVSGQWEVRTAQGVFRAPVVVDAAGAWVDVVAARAGVAPLGVSPLKRTAFTVDAPAGVDVSSWPLVFDADEEFYVKPDAGRLLVSPADQTPSPPCDAGADDLDVAIAVDRLERAFSLSVDRVVSRWAGLRTFVADRSPVAGFAADAEGFFWLAGQGGYGIQLAPALARVTRALILGEPFPGDVAGEGADERSLAPARLGAAQPHR